MASINLPPVMVTGFRPARLVVLVAALVVAGYGLAGSVVATVRELVRLGKLAVTDCNLAAESKQASPVYALGAPYPDIEFLSQALDSIGAQRLWYRLPQLLQR